MAKFEQIFIGFLLGLIASVFGAFIAHLFSERRNRRNEFNHAATALYDKFLGTILFLEHNMDKGDGRIVTDNVYEFLNTRKMEYLSAILNFKPFLTKKNRTEIQNAWDEFCHPDGVPETEEEKREFALIEYHHIQETNSDEAAKEAALEKIKKILAFASLKG